MNRTHGLNYHPLYKRWHGMKSRCSKSSNVYEQYAGRGITVCEEWNSSFLKFYQWAIENGFREDLSLDRIDNNKGYCPENCRWATRFQQARNVRRNRLVTYNGKTQCIGAWSEETGIRRDTLLYRLNHCKSIDDVFKRINLHTSKKIQDVRR